MDLASRTIKNQLIELYPFENSGENFEGSPILTYKNIKLVTTERDLIFCDQLDDYFNTDFYIFISRHKSASGTPALLVHTTGNWIDESAYGGSPREIAVAPAGALRRAFKELMGFKVEKKLRKYDVTMEVTHHGPTNLTTPLLFVELGSTAREWQDANAAKIIAQVCFKVATMKTEDHIESAVGFGGPHYCPRFNQLILNSNIAIGHIIPKYVMDKIKPEMILEAVKQTLGPPKYAILDWKGLTSKQRIYIKTTLSQTNLIIQRAKDLLL